jgi:chromosome segregation ATPase
MENLFMRYFKIFIIITFLMFSAGASAEFYKYVDDDGNVRFTDDINQVPEAQREKIRSYVESESPKPAEPEITGENKPDQVSEDQQTDFTDLTDDESESLDDAKKRIDELRNEIDEEYKALMKEKEALAKDKTQAKTRDQIIEFNKRVDSLNKRVAAYEKKGKDYQAQVDAYNQRITQQSSKRQTQ